MLDFQKNKAPNIVKLRHVHHTCRFTYIHEHLVHYLPTCLISLPQLNPLVPELFFLNFSTSCI